MILIEIYDVHQLEENDKRKERKRNKKKKESCNISKRNSDF